MVTILGAVVAYSIWSFAAKQVAKDHQPANAPSQVSGPASTTGNQSPAVTGNGNSFDYEPSSPERKTEPPK